MKIKFYPEIVKRNAVGIPSTDAKKRNSAKHKKKSEKGKDEEAWERHRTVTAMPTAAPEVLPGPSDSRISPGEGLRSADDRNGSSSLGMPTLAFERVRYHWTYSHHLMHVSHVNASQIVLTAAWKEGTPPISIAPGTAQCRLQTLKGASSGSAFRMSRLLSARSGPILISPFVSPH